MDKLSRKILQNTMRFLSAKGYRVLSEFALPNKKRVDIIVEFKSNKNGIKLDKKWKNYLNYCNYFYFACSEKLNFNFSENIGIIRNNCNKIEITKEPKYKKLPENKKNKLIFKISLSAISKFHRLIDPEYKKQKNNSIYIYKKKEIE